MRTSSSCVDVAGAAAAAFTAAATLTALVAMGAMPGAEARLEVISPHSTDKEFTIDELQPITYTMPPDDGAIGRLVVAKPANACVPIKPVPYPSNDTFSWFLLVQRFECGFATKLQHAQRAGYSGVIIYDYDDPDLSFAHVARPYSFNDVRVYAVLITKTDGLLLQRCTWENGYLIEWYPSITPSLLTYLVPCILIILFCILTIACLVVVQQCSRWYRERRRNAKYRLARKYLRQMPIRRWTKGRAEFRNFEVCSICLEEYQDGEKLRVLPCQHGYHSKCIDPWLTKNRRVCPLCKRKIVLPGMPEDSSDDETAPLLSTRHETSGGTFQPAESSNRTVQIDVHIDVEHEAQTESEAAAALAPGGHYSVNDEVEVLPRPRRAKRKKRTRRPREPLNDVTVAGPSVASTSTASVPDNLRLASENQMLCVTEMGSDDDQPLLA